MIKSAYVKCFEDHIQIPLKTGPLHVPFSLIREIIIEKQSGTTDSDKHTSHNIAIEEDDEVKIECANCKAILFVKQNMLKEKYKCPNCKFVGKNASASSSHITTLFLVGVALIILAFIAFLMSSNKTADEKKSESSKSTANDSSNDNSPLVNSKKENNVSNEISTKDNSKNSNFETKDKTRNKVSKSKISYDGKKWQEIMSNLHDGKNNNYVIVGYDDQNILLIGGYYMDAGWESGMAGGKPFSRGVGRTIYRIKDESWSIVPRMYGRTVFLSKTKLLNFYRFSVLDDSGIEELTLENYEKSPLYDKGSRVIKISDNHFNFINYKETISYINGRVRLLENERKPIFVLDKNGQPTENRIFTNIYAKTFDSIVFSIGVGNYYTDLRHVRQYKDGYWFELYRAEHDIIDFFYSKDDRALYLLGHENISKYYLESKKVKILDLPGILNIKSQSPLCQIWLDNDKLWVIKLNGAIYEYHADIWREVNSGNFESFNFIWVSPAYNIYATKDDKLYLLKQ